MAKLKVGSKVTVKDRDGNDREGFVRFFLPGSPYPYLVEYVQTGCFNRSEIKKRK